MQWLSHMSVQLCFLVDSCGLGLNGLTLGPHLSTFSPGPMASVSAFLGLCHSIGDLGYPPLYLGQLPPSPSAFGKVQDLGNLPLAVAQVGEPQSHQMREIAQS